MTRHQFLVKIGLEHRTKVKILRGILEHHRNVQRLFTPKVNKIKRKFLVFIEFRKSTIFQLLYPKAFFGKSKALEKTETDPNDCKGMAKSKDLSTFGNLGNCKVAGP